MDSNKCILFIGCGISSRRCSNHYFGNNAILTQLIVIGIKRERNGNTMLTSNGKEKFLIIFNMASFALSLSLCVCLSVRAFLPLFSRYFYYPSLLAHTRKYTVGWMNIKPLILANKQTLSSQLAKLLCK